MTIKSEILQTIEERKKWCKDYPYDMISAYNREIETEKEYNGRQLLELLQNADDENSNEVLINLDTHENLLQISNRGDNCKPFSYEGIRSLMISNLSSKTTKKFIGNKGLGFRSIINWSEQITINSNNLDIIFSKQIVSKIYDELFDKKQHKQLVEERNLPLNIKPIPFLSIPNIEDNDNLQWTTTILIIFKDIFLQDIQKQLNELKEEILLFLNSITRLTVIVDNNKIFDVKKEDLETKYTIYQKKEKLPIDLWDKENEEEYYDLKIALHNHLDNNIHELFAYFPTKIDIKFPFIIHGTFDLNSSRNQINDSQKNRFILKKLVELIVETAKIITQKEVSYKALEMLTYNYQDHILKELGFYSYIDYILEELEVFPCLDNTYRKKNNVIYIDELSIFVNNINKADIFPNLLIPNNVKINLSKHLLSTSVTKDKLNILSRSITDIDQRVDLIYMFYHTFKHQNKLEFLIDKNMNLISLEDDVFTPSKYEFSIPSYVNIKFMNKELFDKLILKFRIESNEKSRDLQRILKEITNIQSYEPAPVLQKIITSTNQELKNDNINKEYFIVEMVQSLYENFMLVEKTTIPIDTKVQLLNRNKTLTDAKNLYLSNSYPSGKMTEYLFKNIFSNNDFLANIQIYKFQNEVIEDVEEFFLWLGVNKYTKFNKINSDSNYEKFIFTKIDKPLAYRDSSFEVKSIDRFQEIMKSISIEKLIIWFLIDEKIYNHLDYNNDDVLKYSKAGESYYSFRHIIYKKPSYILYQIVSSGIFNDFLVGNDKFNLIANTIQINYEDNQLKKFNKSDIDSLLLKIGAVEKFEKLSIERVSNIVKELPFKSLEGRFAQLLYKLCIKHYEKNHKALIYKEDIKLFAKKGEFKHYFSLSDVFYNGNIKLPKRITDSKAILDYPRRQSTKNVISFFGINNLKSIEINVIHQNVSENLTQEFHKLLNKINEYILVYRIKDIEIDKVANEELRKLKNLDIKLCNEVEYNIDDENFKLETNDYILNNSSYLIKINVNQSLQQMINTFEFQETFADIIGLVFDIQDTEIFRQILKEDSKYIEKTIRNDIGSEELIRARELLGKSDEKVSFWSIIFSLINQDVVNFNTPNLLENIVEQLHIKTDITQIDYNHLNSYEDCVFLMQLFTELNITIEDYNKMEPFYQIDFTEYHKVHLKQAFEDNYYLFQREIYSYCIQTNQEKYFNDFKAKYNHNNSYIQKESTDNKHAMNLNYSDKVKAFVSNNFDLIGISKTDIDFISIYEYNSSQCDIECLNGNNEYISLMYFENTLENIKNYYKIIADLENKDNKDSDIFNKSLKPIVVSPLSSPEHKTFNHNDNKKPFKHNLQKESRQKEKGNRSEEDVYFSLIEEYGKNNVFRVSNDDDSLGYDIKYKNHDGIWKYVEVKTYNGYQFNLTKNEKEFAQKHYGFYELFLVSNQKIYKIENVDYTNDKKFILIENEYIVKYNIKEK